MVSNSLCDVLFRRNPNDSNSSNLANDIAYMIRQNKLPDIEFVDAKEQSPQSFLKKYRSKYIVLNSSVEPIKTDQKKVEESNDKQIKGGIIVSNKIKVVKQNPLAKKFLFPPEKLEHSWKKPSKPGCGLMNLGNTCYLNSSLQCFTYTPALSNYLIRTNHRISCNVKSSFCMLCALQQHLSTAYSSGQAFKPMKILNHLQLIARHLRVNRQEDAHEFIRFSIDAMQKSCLYGLPKNLDEYTKSTTVVHQIFGGYLRSRVICGRCKVASDKYEFCLDISLSLGNKKDIRGCLEIFVKPDRLDGVNAYKCERCKVSSSAIKNLTIYQPPNVLTIQLKRFTELGRKISGLVRYPSKLNLRSYMSVTTGSDVWYDLYAVLVHSGGCSSVGHYYSYAKVANGRWYCFNDNYVSPVHIDDVLNAEAYVLFYNICTSKFSVNKMMKPVKIIKSVVDHNIKSPSTSKDSQQVKRKLSDTSPDEVQKKKVFDLKNSFNSPTSSIKTNEQKFSFNNINNFDSNSNSSQTKFLKSPFKFSFSTKEKKTAKNETTFDKSSPIKSPVEKTVSPIKEGNKNGSDKFDASTSSDNAAYKRSNDTNESSVHPLKVAKLDDQSSSDGINNIKSSKSDEKDCSQMTTPEVNGQKKSKLFKKFLSFTNETKKEMSSNKRKEQLQKMFEQAKSQSFGKGQLGTWNDCKSENKYLTNKIKKVTDKWDEEFDKGKKKKIKKKSKHVIGRINLFQDFQKQKIQTT